MLVELPIVALATSLDEAMKRLKETRRGAVVADRDGEYVLVYASEIVHGSNARIGTIEVLTKLKIVPSLRSLAVPQQHFSTIGKKVGGVQRDFLVVNIVDKDLVARIANEVRLYYCDGPQEHSFLPGEVSIGQECPEGDGGVIRG